MVLSIWLWDSAASCQAGDILPEAEILLLSKSPGLTGLKLWWEPGRTLSGRAVLQDPILIYPDGHGGSWCHLTFFLLFSLEWQIFLYSFIYLYTCVLRVWMASHVHIIFNHCPHYCLKQGLSSNLELIGEFQESSCLYPSPMIPGLCSCEWLYTKMCRLELRSFLMLDNRHFITAFSLAILFLNDQSQAMVTPCLESIKKCVGITFLLYAFLLLERPSNSGISLFENLLVPYDL